MTHCRGNIHFLYNVLSALQGQINNAKNPKNITPGQMHMAEVAQ